MSYTSAIMTSGRGPGTVGGSAPPGGSFAAKLTNSGQEHAPAHSLPSSVSSTSAPVSRTGRSHTLTVIFVFFVYFIFSYFPKCMVTL